MSQELHIYLEKACFFMIAAQLLFHFLPSKKYEKYMGMLTGFICLTILLIPVGNLIFHNNSWLDMTKIEEFEESLQTVLSAEEIISQKEKYESISKKLQEIYSKEEQVKEKLDRIVSGYGYEIQDISYEKNGEEKLCITLSKTEENRTIAVEKITLEEKQDKTLPAKLKESIAKELMVDEEYIEIQ